MIHAEAVGNFGNSAIGCQRVSLGLSGSETGNIYTGKDSIQEGVEISMRFNPSKAD